MSNKKINRGTVFAPEIAASAAASRHEFEGLTQPESWLSRRASQEASAALSYKPVRVHSQVKTFDTSPFQEHQTSYQTELAGVVKICVNKRTKKAVAIRKVPGCTKAMLQKLIPAIHESIVQFSTAYYFKDSIYLVYERMLVSLDEICSTPHGDLPDTAIASASMSILKGLAFIHNDLNMSHGAIKSENVLLNSLGQVKIGRCSPPS
jgi:serine/threonine protein kinase